MISKFKILMIASMFAVMTIAFAGCDDDFDDQQQTVTTEPNTAAPTEQSTNAPVTGQGQNGGQPQQAGNGGNGYGYRYHHEEDHHGQCSLPDIGHEKAVAIALEKIPGATVSNVIEVERDCDGHVLEYDGEIFYDGYEYEFEIDGSTGNLIKWEIDD